MTEGHISNIIKTEEINFFKVLVNGHKLIYKYLQSEEYKSKTGDIVFELYDRYSFPPDISIDIFKKHNIDVDINRYKELMETQKENSKNARLL